MTTGDYEAQPGPASDRYSPTEPGGLLVRFLARVVDGIIVGIVGFVIVFALDVQSNLVVTGLFTGVLTFVYFVAFEVTQGWTPGKKVFGLTVRGPAGASKPDVAQSAIRNAFTVLPVVPLVGGLLGVIAIIVIAVTISGSPTKQGKHDELAGGTQVLKT